MEQVGRGSNIRAGDMSEQSMNEPVGTSDRVAATLREVLRDRLRAVESRLSETIKAARNLGAKDQREQVNAVHGLRVATRKSAAVLDAMGALLEPRHVKATMKRLKRLRSAGGQVRDCDVQQSVLSELAVECSERERYMIELVRASIDSERADAWRALRKAAKRDDLQDVKREHKQLAATFDEATLAGNRVETLARERVARLVSETRHAAAHDLSTVEGAHELRLACKRLRYGIDALEPWLRGIDTHEALECLKNVQVELGRFNDSHQTLRRVEAFAGGEVRRQESRSPAAPPAQDSDIADLVTMQSIVTRLRLRVEQDHESAIKLWRSTAERRLTTLTAHTETPQGVVEHPTLASVAPNDQTRTSDTAPDSRSGMLKAEGTVDGVSERTPKPQPSIPNAGRDRTNSRGTRIAAIDIGSNSTRLIIAEVSPGGNGRPAAQSGGAFDQDVSYRILDDERELTRLGKGLDATGRLDADSLRHAAWTIKRMKGIADGYGVEKIRAVATAAVREASNGQDFVDLVRSEAGLEVEVISADEEAMLSYRSASRAFDLGASPAIVVDVGGGSTEVVLSVPAAMRRRAGILNSASATPGETDGPRGERHRENGESVRLTEDTAGEQGGGEVVSGGGVIERVYKIPLGAVRLTERFGGPEECSKARFDEMRRAIKRQFEAVIGQPPVVPLVLIGTGGTFSSLGSMCAHGELGPAVAGLFAGTVQGYEVKRPQVMHLLDLLRKLSLKERAKVPGLNSDRADIIVAGLALIDRLMKYFRVNHIRVHDGGVRDGVLLAMAMDIQAARSIGKPSRRDPMRPVKRFARACGYEQAHSKHVAKLCLRVFDQLAAVFHSREHHSDAQARTVRPESHPGQSAGSVNSNDNDSSRAQASGPRNTQPECADAHAHPPSKLAAVFTPENRILLEAAALLHDVGYLINYSSHHKHSYHLVMHADLQGFTRREVEVIANVGRYHRLSEPKKSHRNFAQLSKPDRRLVRVLAGILRVCDGLDRTHTQSVEGIDVSIDRRRSRAVLGIRSISEPSVDIWGAQRKSGLFAKMLKLDPVIEWSPVAASTPDASVPTPISPVPSIVVRDAVVAR